MKIHTEDPRLTAHLLGELSPEESATVELAAEADPDVQKALQELENTCNTLTGALAAGPAKLLGSQRAAVLEAARQADRSRKTQTRPTASAVRNWIAVTAIAAAVVIGFFFASRPPAKIPAATVKQPAAAGTNEKTTIAPAPVSKPSETLPPPPSLPGASDEPVVAVASDKTYIELPILAIKPNLDKIIQSVRVERSLPQRDSIRLENVLNSFPIRLNGVTAIARASKQNWHPDTREAGITTLSATLATETLACPWKPSATLVLITIRGNAAGDCEVKVIYRPDTATTAISRLLGYTGAQGTASAKTPATLHANSATTLAIEVEPRTSTGDLGVIEWSVDGVPAANVKLARNPGVEPSNDARFAALACAYAQWLAGERRDTIDKEVLSAFAREVSAPDLPAERADFIKLVNESLNL